MSEINKEGLEARLERVRLRTSQALDDRVKATLAGAGTDAGAEAPSKKGRTAMFRMIRTVGGKLSLAAASVAIAVGVACYLMGSRSIAFADVLEKVNSVHTVRFTQSIPDWKSLPAQDGQWIQRDDGKTRCTFPGGVILIFDLSQGKALALDTLKKTAVFYTQAGWEKPSVPKNFLEQMKNLRDSSHEDLGKKEIDGKSTKGFRARTQGSDWRIWTIWVDEKTELPVRVEVETVRGQLIVLSNFVFNELVDESLFSMTPPTGYKVTENVATERTERYQPESEADLVEGLRAFSIMVPGRFPSEITGAAIMKELPTINRRGVNVESDRASVAIVRGLAFVVRLRLKPDNDWHYAAEGVKPGDASKALCWYRPDGSKTYRVVYGDFSVRDCNSSDLPTAPSK